MTPVDQTKFMETSADGRGDCLRACIASVLDLPSEAIPDFSADGTYIHGAMRWLKARGYTSLRIDWTGDGYEQHQYFSCDHYVILSGKSPRSTTENRSNHAVVAHAMGWGFKIDHDPHPSHAGLAGNPDFMLWIFRPL